MSELLTRAGCFVGIIVLGFVLRRVGLFREDDFRVLSNIIIKITLPAAIVTSFAGKTVDPSMLSIVLFGLGCGALYIGAAFAINLRSSKERRAFEILNLPGYNIGCFTMPFAQSFLGPTAVIVTSLFDTGNAFVCLGGSFGIASMVKDGSGFSFRRILTSLGRSVPFMTYILMVTLNLAKITVPAPIVSFAQIISNANAFMAMLMIGVGFKLTGERSQIGAVVRILVVRYALAAVLAAVFWNLTVFSLEVRQALVILVFSPIGSAVPGFTRELKGDVGLSCSVNSIAIVISIVIMVSLLAVMM